MTDKETASDYPSGGFGISDAGAQTSRDPNRWINAPITPSNPDNRPSMEDYLDSKGAVFVLVNLELPLYAGGYIQHLEVISRPPTFRFEDRDMTCFVANVNGGDSQQFYYLNHMKQYLEQEYQDWLDGIEEE
jgi:hypothetical protein